MTEIILGISLPLIKFVINIFILSVSFKNKDNIMKGFFISLGLGFGFILIGTLLIFIFMEIDFLQFVITLFISYIIFMIFEILFFLRKNKFVDLQR